MPLVERHCECGHRWEDLVGMTQSPPDTECPICGGSELSQALGSFRIDVCGTEQMTAGDLAAAHDNKRCIESEAHRVHSGAIQISQSSRVPLELRPDIPRRFH